MPIIFFRSFRNAFRGLRVVWLQVRNFRIQVIIGFLVIAATVLLGFSLSEIALILIGVALVLTGEILNTMVEDLLDVIKPHFNFHVGKVKDVTAGLVLLLSVFSMALGAIVICHHYL